MMTDLQQKKIERASEFFFSRKKIDFPQKKERAKKRHFFSKNWYSAKMGLAKKKKSNTDVIFRLEKNGVSKQKWSGAIKNIKNGALKKMERRNNFHSVFMIFDDRPPLHKFLGKTFIRVTSVSTLDVLLHPLISQCRQGYFCVGKTLIYVQMVTMVTMVT